MRISRNPKICVWILKDDVAIWGYGDGTWAGGATTLEVIEPAWCQPLDWVQTYGGP